MGYVRKCPHCKSNKGFRITTLIGGYQEDTYSFTGKLIDSYRNGVDKVEAYAECVECGRSILAEKCKHEA